ncbi:MAG: Uma2 family endonuclease [Chloroflexi bacterium]|nr:Uma2 family endonuclease [Chloroflexota bacterium]
MTQMTVPLPHRKFTVDDYHAMARAGILDEDERVELIDGEIVEMPPIGPWHAWRVDGITELFRRTLGDVAHVRAQNPARLSAYSEPVPDLMLLRRREDGYRFAHPGPDDVLLVVEVADTSAARDRRVKVPHYARARIPEVWLLDMKRDALSVFCDPEQGEYRTVQVAHRGERIAPGAFPDRMLEVSELLG